MLTVIVPVMNEWIVQWYGYTPAVLNVKEYMSPGASRPESQTAVSDVDVCVIPPMFTQQTVVPTGTVTSAGSKKSSWMLITVEPPGQPVGT